MPLNQARVPGPLRVPGKPTVHIDADACPVKDEVYRVADRLGCPVAVVSNSFLRVPQSHKTDIRLVVVDAGADVADDWIVEQTTPGDIAITADLPLADRVLKIGGAAISPTGTVFTQASIASALATRGVLEHLRSMGEPTGGPKPFTRADRSAFLSALDTLVHRQIRRIAMSS